ncbi:MAG TPA: hypothetical protein EYN67_18120 [Flavobacteriales bacterium]|nr:hypothetical protein [Flavobacteriales bacterium]
MEEFKFNMNNSVKVKLNDVGHAELKRQHDVVAANIDYNIEYKEVPVDKDGYSSFQMHDLMHTFGHMMVMGCKTPFETLSIKIAEVLLKPVK